MVELFTNIIPLPSWFQPWPIHGRASKVCKRPDDGKSLWTLCQGVKHAGHAKAEEFNAQSEYKQVPATIVVIVMSCWPGRWLRGDAIRLDRSARCRAHILHPASTADVMVCRTGVPSAAFAALLRTPADFWMKWYKTAWSRRYASLTDWWNHPPVFAFISDDDVNDKPLSLPSDDHDESFIQEFWKMKENFQSGGDPLFEEAATWILRRNKALWFSYDSWFNAS